MMFRSNFRLNKSIINKNISFKLYISNFPDFTCCTDLTFENSLSSISPVLSFLHLPPFLKVKLSHFTVSNPPPPGHIATVALASRQIACLCAKQCTVCVGSLKSCI